MRCNSSGLTQQQMTFSMLRWHGHHRGVRGGLTNTFNYLSFYQKELVIRNTGGSEIASSSSS